MITHPCRRKCTSQYKITNEEPIWQPLPGDDRWPGPVFGNDPERPLAAE
jgi:hypothetical protein